MSHGVHSGVRGGKLGHQQLSVHSRRRVVDNITATYYLTAALKLMTILWEKQQSTENHARSALGSKGSFCRACLLGCIVGEQLDVSRNHAPHSNQLEICFSWGEQDGHAV